MTLLMFITKWMFKIIYRVRLTGLDNFNNSGQRTLIIANHISFLDGILLGLFLPQGISFGIHSKYYNRWWFAPIKRTMPIFAIDHSDPMAMKTIIQHIQAGQKVVVFPEGRISNTGSLMKIYPGSAMMADKADAYILPIRINGAQFTPFSRMQDLLKLRWFPQITLDILPAQKLELPESLNHRERRKKGAQMLEDIMRDMLFHTSNYKLRLWDKLLEAANTHGKKHEIIEDLERTPLTYSDVFTRAMVLQQLLPQSMQHGERVGLLLPNVNACYITFFAIQARGAVPALLNFTMGESATTAALETATIQTVITSRKFIEAAELEHLVEIIEKKANVVYLEDLKSKLSIAHKLKGLFMAKFSSIGIRRLIKNVDSSDAAVVLFTSGSEGTPKGVVLSHENILANIEQINASIPFNTHDVCLNTLPFFHSFGFTAGSMLTTFNGIKTFFYPSPLHYKIIPEFAYDIDATILFGTNVFLAAYAKHAHPYDFQTMKYAVAGAEKLQDKTRETWMLKFGIRILEGYGATETTPVISVNTPMHYKLHSVGRMMPGMQYRLEHVPGISKGGRLFVKAPNVMKGYLMHDNPGVLLPPEGGWYDTGDIVSIDDEGFLSIQGRAKRFAKVAGEMLSLTAVEELCKHCWPEHDHVALAFPDPCKGEKIVLMSTLEKPNRKELVQFSHESGVNDMLVPRQYLFVSEVPLLGTGKIHYVAAQALAEKMLKEKDE
ncbi:MAG: AMP-binding protein [Ghiorsea sp.]|nr:AMP-binding protein [Ghiorsea sp.]